MAAQEMSLMHPDILPPVHAIEIWNQAHLEYVKPDRVRELEEKTGHDVIAINTALEEVLTREAAAHVNKARTSADTTESAKALQIKDSIRVVVGSLDNLRDIILERAWLDWGKVPHQDTTHWYDALPTVAGRPFAFFAEMLQSDIERLVYAYDNSLYGKWADATGNHHSAKALGIDGVELQKKYCERLEVRCMTAPAQIPGREFLFDVVAAMTRTAGTIANLADYIRWGRSDDVAIFKFPLGKKGSSAMPHKDAKGGNPTSEEQADSYFRYMQGVLTTATASMPFAYARDLSASASDRICLGGMFKFGDHTIRNMAGVMYKLVLDEDRSRERVARTHGVTTAQQVMTYLTDGRLVKEPLPRSEAHELTARLATEAFQNKHPFAEVCQGNACIRETLGEDGVRPLTDPFKYTGESERILQEVYEKYHGKKTELR
jgi:adenylosuccinate lyase